MAVKGLEEECSYLCQKVRCYTMNEWGLTLTVLRIREHFTVMPIQIQVRVELRLDPNPTVTKISNKSFTDVPANLDKFKSNMF